MMKFRLRKIFVAFVALAGVLTIAYFYLLVLVPNKESELSSRGLRILSRIEQNIHEKKANIQKTLDGVYGKRDSGGKRTFQGSFFKGLSIDPDSVIKDVENKIEPGNFNLIYDAVRDKQQIRFFGQYSKGNAIQKGSVLAYRYNMEDFLKDVLFYRDDFFEDYIVLYQGKVVYQTSPLAYAGFEAGAADPVKKKPNDRHGSALFGDWVKRDTLGGKGRFVFVHPFNQASQINFVLCGVISAEKYNNEKYLLNTTQIIWITLIFVMAVFLLPILKLFTVSEFERLSQQDVLRIGIALTAGSSVLTVCFLLWIHNSSQYNRQAYVTRQVAKTIERRMVEEVKKISLQLDYQIDLIRAEPLYKRWICSQPASGAAGTSLKLPDPHHHQVENFVLLDNNGVGSVFDMKKMAPPDKLDLHEREYFMAFDPKHPKLSPYTIKQGVDKTTFYIQPIYSWLDQQNTVVMSKALDANSCGQFVAFALETHMFSLSKPALPAEVSFCVLDKAGRVLFHSDEKRNLRENFIAETGNNLLVRGVITTHVDTTLQVQYYGDEHVAHFKPMNTLPYTIVVLYDTSFFMDALSNQATFTLLMLIALGLLLTVVIAVSYFLTSQQNVLRRQQLSIKWLYFNSPNREAFFNLFCWLWLPVVLSIPFIKGEHVVFFSFFLPVFALALSGAVIYKANRQGYQQGFYRRYVTCQYRIFFWVCAGVNGLLLAALITSGTSISPCVIVIFVLMETAMVALALMPGILPTFKVEEKWREFVRKNPGKRAWGKYMAAPACFLLLLNFSGFPAFNFFITSARYEREIKQKRNSLEMADRIDRRKQWLLSKIESDQLLNDPPAFSLVRNGIYMPVKPLKEDSLSDLKFDKKLTAYKVDKRNFFLSLYNRIINLPNIAYNDKELQTSFLDLNSGEGAEGEWSWKSPSELNYFYRHGPLPDALAAVHISLPVRNTTVHWIMMEDWIKIIAGIGISVVLLFVILVFAHKKITLYEYFNKGPDQDRIRKADEEYIRHSIEQTSRNLLILSLPGSGVVEFVKSLCKKPTVKMGDQWKLAMKEVLDALTAAKVDYQFLAYDPGQSADGQSGRFIVLLSYFDLKDSNSEILQNQLSALNACFKSQILKVVWITASDPCEQVSLLGKRSPALLKVKGEDKKKDETEIAPDAGKLKQERSDILRILNDFEKVTYSLEDRLKVDQEDSARYLREEFRFGLYLDSLGKRVTEDSGDQNTAILDTYFKDINPDLLSANKRCFCKVNFPKAEEHFILKIQDMAQNYYYSVWVGLSTREKYVLYDFASDEITNYRNFGILSALVRKGLLYYDGRLGGLRVMSRSFRNFVLTVVDKEEALQLEKEINISGTWETIRIVLVIFFVAIALFLFATEKTTFNRIIGFITAVASIGPVLFAFVTNLRGLSFGK